MIDKETNNFIDKVILFSMQRRLVVFLFAAVAVFWGIMVAPFDWQLEWLPRDPVAVDAIPDIGENQQIVFTEWMGRSPQDVEDQISYPLTVALLGVPGVKTIRSYSMFGFSTVYIIFKDDVEFYWSRSRVLERLNSLSSGTLPEGVNPSLGPDATALGQVFWYTLEGRDPQGNPTGGWDLQELRTIQDWFVRYGLMAADGVAEVASVGGFVQEYQIDVDPDAMRGQGVTLTEVIEAIRSANSEVGARTIEINRVEYVVRGLGFVKDLEDLENAVIKVRDNVPIFVRNVAHVTRGPAARRGALDKQGAEAVGGVVVVRYGENPMAAIKNVKAKIKEISPGLPRKTLSDGTVSQIEIVPFYDRTGLINETLGTLNTALVLQILVTIIVVLILVLNLASSLLISGVLPLAVLMCFIAMKTFGVDANIVALSGIAIAIGTMVDMGIVVCENILKHIEELPPESHKFDAVFNATKEVGSAVVTAVATTVVSFLPVFMMEAAEGKLFKPLAFTKTFALIASVIVALTIIPALALTVYGRKNKAYRSRERRQTVMSILLIIVGVWIIFRFGLLRGLAVVLFGLYEFFEEIIPERIRKHLSNLPTFILAVLVTLVLARHWLPLGPEKGMTQNFLFVALLIGSLLGLFYLVQLVYGSVLRWCLDNKILFMVVPTIFVVLGGMVWLGFSSIFGWLPEEVKSSRPYVYLNHEFPGLGKEFMPPLDEGSYLYMPTTMPHASVAEALEVLQMQDMAIHSIPEVEEVVGKIGRVDSPLDPAPVSMIETIINYKPEYLVDESGHRLSYRFISDETDFFRSPSGEPVLAPDGQPYVVHGKFQRDENDGSLIPDDDGKSFRLWRPPLDPDLNPEREFWPGIVNPENIWDEIVDAATLPGTTSAPKLQPIAARIVMLQSGMRAPMGIKVRGPDLKTIEKVAVEIEELLKEVVSVEPSAVFADRIVGKPYLEIDIDRLAIARYGIKLKTVHDIIEVAIGGKMITETVEGRERYPVRIRYMRELRDDFDSIGKILVPTPSGSQIPLTQLAEVNYVRGPQVIKSEDTFLLGYVLFDKKPGYSEVETVEQAQDYLDAKIQDGTLEIPAGVSYSFSGSYENQVRSEKRLRVILPIALIVIFLILYFQFSSVSTTSLVFSGIVVAWSGGFLMIWLYSQPWFLDFVLFGVNMRDLFQVHPLNLSVAVWVGFLALFGIATDDGVVMATYLEQSFETRVPESKEDIRVATVAAGKRRIRPCLMTTATTILALIPVLTSTGRGADIMVPMAIPSFGGMSIEILTMFVVPVLYCAIKETALRRRMKKRSAK